MSADAPQPSDTVVPSSVTDVVDPFEELQANTDAAAVGDDKKEAGEEIPAGEEPAKKEEKQAGEEDGSKEPTTEGKPTGEPGESAELSDFTFPEGYATTEESVASYKEWAEKTGLSQEQAQAFIDFDAKRGKENSAKTTELLAKQEQEWDDFVRADPTLGANIHTTNERVDAALKFFSSGDEDTKTFLQQTGTAKHPGFIRMMFRAHEAIQHLSPDTFSAGKDASGAGTKTLEQRLAPEFQ